MIVVFLIVSSLDNSFIYDTLVYHFYTIKVLGAYPAIPGIGNLFTYLGINQSYFLYPAFLNALWGHYQGACAANGLLALVICTEIVWRNAACLQGKQKLSFYALFQLLFLPLCINVGVQNLSSPTPDVFINLLTFKVMADMIACIEAKEKLTFLDLFLPAFYCLLGVVMKFSFIGVALGAAMVLLWALITNKLYRAGSMLIAAGIALLLIVPWVIRGGITSGYIAFPATALPLPADWRMPAKELTYYLAYVKGFARTHLHGQPAIDAAYTYTWIPAWIKRMLTTFGFIVPVLLAVGAAVLLRIKRIGAAKLYAVLIPLVIAMAFWLVIAPDIRFAAFAFWAFGLAPAAYLISHYPVKYLRLFLPFIFVCCLLMMVRNFNKDITPLGDVQHINSKVFVTASGLKINVVANSATSDDWIIGDCDIPCSVHPDSALTMRGSTIQNGFKLALPAKNTPPQAR
ncbi:membrane protein [Mucilaginibacter phyllosphaerae]|nr:membrane protein [Mucilaginibacter phyllosphaerae]